MNIVHITLADHHGGAAIAARRLHTALRGAGHDSRMLVWRKYGDDPTIELFERRPIQRALSHGVGVQLDKLGLQGLFHPASMRLHNHPWIRRADIINLHLLHGGFFSMRALPQLSRKAPVVWTMHDMWAVTGHCATASYELCDRWRSGCGTCAYKNNFPAVKVDLTAQIWQVKKRNYRRSRISVVAPSQWMAERLRLSPLLRHYTIHCLANGLDLSLFYPLDKQVARQALGIQSTKKVLMFSATSLSDPLKGGRLLQTALLSMPKIVKDSVMLLFVGGKYSALASSLRDYEVLALGQVQNEKMIGIAYAASDLFVLPTQADNLPNVLVESLACGTPCVTFDLGGCPEIIEHGKNGYLAEAGNADDLAVGIRQLLQDDQKRLAMGAAGVQKAREEFDADKQASLYLQLYKTCLST